MPRPHTQQSWSAVHRRGFEMLGYFIMGLLAFGTTLGLHSRRGYGCCHCKQQIQGRHRHASLRITCSMLIACATLAASQHWTTYISFSLSVCNAMPQCLPEQITVVCRVFLTGVSRLTEASPLLLVQAATPLHVGYAQVTVAR